MPMGQVAGAPRVRSARGDSFAGEQRTIGLTSRRPLRFPVSPLSHRAARGVVMRAVVERRRRRSVGRGRRPLHHMTTTRQTDPQNDFGLLLDTYQTEIPRYLRRLTGDAATADDLFQDTFLRAFKAFSRLRANPNHRAWLYRIATNRFLNHRRRRRHGVEVPLAADIRSRTPSPAAIHEHATVAATLRQAIARLPKRQRAAFIQRQLHGFSYKEVSAVLGCTQTAALGRHADSCCGCKKEWQRVDLIRRALSRAGTADEPGATDVRRARERLRTALDRAGHPPIRFGKVTTPVGSVFIGLTEHEVCDLTFGQASERDYRAALLRRAPEAWRDDVLVVPVAEQIATYFAGTLTRFAVPLDLRQVTSFTARVLRETRKVRFGRLTSYGALADRLGPPGASRAVGGRWGAIRSRSSCPVIESSRRAGLPAASRPSDSCSESRGTSSLSPRRRCSSTQTGLRPEPPATAARGPRKPHSASARRARARLTSTYGGGWCRGCRRAAERSGFDTDGPPTRVGTAHRQPRSRGRHVAEGRQVHRLRFFLVIPVIGLPQQLLELFRLFLLRGGRCERCTTASTVVWTTATGWTHPRRSRPGPSDAGHLPRRRWLAHRHHQDAVEPRVPVRKLRAWRGEVAGCVAQQCAQGARFRHVDEFQGYDLVSQSVRVNDGGIADTAPLREDCLDRHLLRPDRDPAVLEGQLEVVSGVGRPRQGQHDADRSEPNHELREGHLGHQVKHTTLDTGTHATSSDGAAPRTPPDPRGPREPHSAAARCARARRGSQRRKRRQRRTSHAPEVF